MLLAKGESVVKEWNYSKVSRSEVMAKVILTNRRLVHYTSNPIASMQEEVPVSKIKNISYTNHPATSSKAGIIFGLIVALLGGLMLLFSMEENDFFVPGVITLLVGGAILLIALASYGASKMLGAKFTLLVTTIGSDGSGLEIGNAVNLAGKRVKPEIIGIVVDSDTVEDLMNSLGAYIIDIQQGLYESAE